MKTPYMVGITGGSGAGKTHFLHRLMEDFSEEEVCLVSQDNYYKPLEEQEKDRNGVYNFDLPAAIDAVQYTQDLINLRSGKSVTLTEYTLNNPSIVPKQITLRPAPVIVVEGIFVFYYPEVSRMLDLKLFIDTKEYLKIKRRIVRDNLERGYDIDDVLYRYENHAAPAYEKYIEPYKSEANLVIPNNFQFDKSIEVLKTFLQSKIAAFSTD
jgi:uridine kinase